MTSSIFESDLEKNAANYSQLSPLSFIERAASVYPQQPALIYNDRKFNWSEVYRRYRRFASALQKHGVGPDDTVALVLPNVSAMYEARFAIIKCSNPIDANGLEML